MPHFSYTHTEVTAYVIVRYLLLYSTFQTWYDNRSRNINLRETIYWFLSRTDVRFTTEREVWSAHGLWWHSTTNHWVWWESSWFLYSYGILLTKSAITPSLVCRVTLSHCHTATLSCSHAITLSHCHTVTLPHCHTVTLSHSHIVTLSHSHTVTLSHSHIVTQSHFQAVAN